MHLLLFLPTTMRPERSRARSRGTLAPRLLITVFPRAKRVASQMVSGLKKAGLRNISNHWELHSCILCTRLVTLQKRRPRPGAFLVDRIAPKLLFSWIRRRLSKGAEINHPPARKRCEFNNQPQWTVLDRMWWKEKLINIIAWTGTRHSLRKHHQNGI